MWFVAKSPVTLTLFPPQLCVLFCFVFPSSGLFQYFLFVFGFLLQEYNIHRLCSFGVWHKFWKILSYWYFKYLFSYFILLLLVVMQDRPLVIVPKLIGFVVRFFFFTLHCSLRNFY